jgi:hypothetical protein
MQTTISAFDLFYRVSCESARTRSFRSEAARERFIDRLVEKYGSGAVEVRFPAEEAS